jgi:uncharacterized Zn-binding protein involved in type VI secretion
MNLSMIRHFSNPSCREKALSNPVHELPPIVPREAIRKGVPLPPRSGNRNGAGRPPGRTDANPAYPFRWMEVGDSFVVPLTGTEDDHNGKAIARLTSTVHIAGKRAARKYAIRHTGEGLATIWRVE